MSCKPLAETKVWRIPGLNDLELLHAQHLTQSFPRHTHECYAVGVVEQGVWGGSSFIGALFLVAGGAFLVRLYNRKPKHLWALFTGFALFGAAASALGGALAGSYFLALLGAGFAVAYAQNLRHWWAVIPAGVLFTLATVAGADALLPGIDALGLAILSGSFSGGPLLPLLLVGAGAYLLTRHKQNRLESAVEPFAAQVSGLEPNSKSLEPSEKV